MFSAEESKEAPRMLLISQWELLLSAVLFIIFKIMETQVIQTQIEEVTLSLDKLFYDVAQLSYIKMPVSIFEFI